MLFFLDGCETHLQVMLELGMEPCGTLHPIFTAPSSRCGITTPEEVAEYQFAAALAEQMLAGKVVMLRPEGDPFDRYIEQQERTS